MSRDLTDEDSQAQYYSNNFVIEKHVNEARYLTPEVTRTVAKRQMARQLRSLLAVNDQFTRPYIPHKQGWIANAIMTRLGI